jgi:hypothetical protein
MPIRRFLPVVAVLSLMAAFDLVGLAQNRPPRDPRIAKLVDSISADRLRSLLTTLVGFGTRSTASDPSSATRGIGAARQWIFDELTRSSPRLVVSFDTHVFAPQGQLTREAEIRSVLATLPGRSARRIYITAHYDSINFQRLDAPTYTRPANAPPVPDPRLDPKFDHGIEAPGANDNGSGTALTMELARVFAASGLEFDATLVFALWAGEEQAMLGANAHAQDARAQKVPIEAVFNNDIVGNVRGLDGRVDSRTVRVYSSGPEDSPSRSLARYVQRLAATYVSGHRVKLLAREDRFSRGSDHIPFREQGFPSIVFREMAENVARQHSALDTLEGVDFGYLRQNARVNAAAAASLALAPPAPVLTGERGQPLISREPSGADASLRWQPVPGATGYRVYWREAWGNDWQHQRDVGNVTQVTLPRMPIDDLVFGVSAVGTAGIESVISAYVAPPARLPQLQLVAPK